VRARLSESGDPPAGTFAFCSVEHRRWTPSYRGFKGSITVSEDGKKATTRGIISQIKGKSTHYRITEVPIKGNFQGLQNRLSELAEGKRGEEVVRDYKSWSTATDANFEVEFRKGAVANIEDVVKALKLEDDLSLTNMHAFSHQGRITKYSGPDDVIDGFMPVRYELYRKRKAHQIQILSEQALWLREQVNFIRAVCDGSLKIARRSDGEVEKDIVNLGVREIKVGDLLAMPMRSQTESKVRSLEAKLKEAELELKRVKSTSEKQMWLNDLDNLEARLETPKSA
jgi:DNA topoisomerase-2